MRVFALQEPPTSLPIVYKSSFKNILVTGTWQSEKSGAAACADHDRIIEPLKIEWTVRESRVADLTFAFAGFSFLCSAKAASLFDRIGQHFTYHDFETEFGKLGVAAREEINGKKFKWARPKKIISISDILERESVCGACGTVEYKYQHDGLTFRRSQIEAVDAFSVLEYGLTSAVYVTEGYREQLESTRLENLIFREAGSVV
jgi:hypothetical protein